MRLPHLQLHQKFVTAQSQMIAAILRVQKTLVIGMGVELFAFAVEQTSTDETPPDGLFVDPEANVVLEGVMGWTGESGTAVAAFIRAGVIQKLEVGLRVRGCNIYAKAWEKARKDRLRKAGLQTLSVGIPAENARLSTGKRNDSLGQTQTQTQTQTQEAKAKETTGALSVPEQPALLELVATDPTTTRPKEVVFQHWIQKLEKNGNTVLTSEREKTIEARLREGYSSEDMCLAIDGLSLSDWHMGRDPKTNGRRWDDLTYALADGGSVEKYREDAKRHALGVGPGPPASDPRKGFVRADEQDWSSDGGYGDLNEQAKQAKKAREGR